MEGDGAAKAWGGCSLLGQVAPRFWWVAHGLGSGSAFRARCNSPHSTSSYSYICSMLPQISPNMASLTMINVPRSSSGSSAGDFAKTTAMCAAPTSDGLPSGGAAGKPSPFMSALWSGTRNEWRALPDALERLGALESRVFGMGLRQFYIEDCIAKGQGRPAPQTHFRDYVLLLLSQSRTGPGPKVRHYSCLQVVPVPRHYFSFSTQCSGLPPSVRV